MPATCIHKYNVTNLEYRVIQTLLLIAKVQKKNREHEKIV